MRIYHNLAIVERKTMTSFLGASMQHLKSNLTGHVGIIQQFLQICVSDPEPSVRNNAVYALGEMLLHCQESVAE